MDQHPKDQSIAAIGTILVHLLLIISFLGFKIKEPQLETPSVDTFDVMLGEDELGDGAGENIEPSPPSGMQQSSSTISAPASSEQSSSSTPANYTPTNTQDRPNVNPTRSTPTRNTLPNNSSTNTQSESQSTPKAVLGNRNTGQGVGRGSGSGQGESGVAGNQGSPKGNLSYSLGQRKLVQRPNTYGSFSQNGSVKMTIYVNRQGKIVRHRILRSSGSELSALAVKKISQIRFNASPQAPPEQQGTITFNFKLR